MRNSHHYLDDSFEFHKRITQSKYNTHADPEYKTRLDKLENNIRLLFEDYDNHFSSNTLENLSNYGYSGQDKSDLHKLYVFKSRNLQSLKLYLTTTPNNRKSNICQNCTISEINSFDHYLPQEEFPEFVVNPKNLIPSCSKCNSKKNDIWRLNGKRLFLNLYVDLLPELQYLFTNINIVNSTIEVDFYLNNINNINVNLYDIIESHYIRLDLFSRFRENSNNVITNLTNTILSYLGQLTILEIKNSILETCARNKLYFGANYWVSILEESLINNRQFIDYVINESLI